MSHDIVMISDQSRARFFVRDDDKHQFSEISDFINSHEHQSAAGAGRHEPGHASAPSGMWSRVIQGEDRHWRHDWEQFADTLMDTLEGYISDDPHSNVVIVAPPRFLGILRQKMRPSVQQHLLREINHNVTMLTGQALCKLLPDYISREIH